MTTVFSSVKNFEQFNNYLAEFVTIEMNTVFP